MKNSKVFALHSITFALLMLDTLVVQHPVMAIESSSISSDKGSNSYTSHPSLNVVFKQVENSVVQITHKIPTTNVSNPLTENITLGSGFVYDKQGHIITNNHVVGNAKILDITFVDGNRYTAKVTGTDIYSDIAVLQIMQNSDITQQRQQPLLPLLKPFVIGNSSRLEVGDTVIAMGNPFGYKEWSC